jgi:hypothetical protein
MRHDVVEFLTRAREYIPIARELQSEQA